MKDRPLHVHVVGALILGVLLPACGTEPPKGDATRASSSAAPSVAAPTSTITQADYCQRVCERATTCGNEAALGTENLDSAAKSAIEKSAPETLRTCVKDCTSESTTDVRLQLAERCNQEKDCGSFSKCLNELGRELRK